MFSRNIIPLFVLFCVVVPTCSVLFLYKRGMGKKVTYIQTGCKENPLRQDYY